MQSKVDYLYGVFVDTVARNRGVTSKRFLSDMADGRIFLGRQSIKVGLTDGVSTLPKIIAAISNGSIRSNPASVLIKQSVISACLTRITTAFSSPKANKNDARQLILESIAAGAEGSH
ncbi:MAG TPA: hypothetical protein HPP94_03600 [Desulfuromonadales bacterium]|nr:hypothetical protein [Desulfuromonadales bacterium]